MWNTLGVLNYLQALVGKSGIVEELTAPGEPADESDWFWMSECLYIPHAQAAARPVSWYPAPHPLANKLAVEEARNLLPGIVQTHLPSYCTPWACPRHRMLCTCDCCTAVAQAVQHG